MTEWHTFTAAGRAEAEAQWADDPHPDVAPIDMAPPDPIARNVTSNEDCDLCENRGRYTPKRADYGPRNPGIVGCTACEAGKRWRADRWETEA